MLVWLTTSLMHCTVHEWHFSFLLALEMLSNAVPIGFNKFLLAYCEHVLFATKHFRSLDVRSDG